jgi:hypothetical protein
MSVSSCEVDVPAGLKAGFPSRVIVKLETPAAEVDHVNLLLLFSGVTLRVELHIVFE